VDTPAVSANQQGDQAIVWSNRRDAYDSSIEVVTRLRVAPRGRRR
jgi:hypothetical protein